ncbi:MAG: hypothetical protein WED04_11815 [Promethearchaeati archaeon SRVP18_Atabeyarchaeia-1]
MGRTVPSFRMALEQELKKWSQFRRGLRVEEQRILDGLLNDVRRHADAGSLVCSPTISEIVLMSILIELKKQLEKHEAGTASSKNGGEA